MSNRPARVLPLVGSMPPWMPNALCSEHDPDIWFEKSLADVACKICRRCPELDPCFEYAMETPLFGVWGGRTANWRTRHGAPSVRSKDA